MRIDTPQIFRDFSKGVFRKSAVSESLVPQNSVSHSINVLFDTIIGKAVVRPGTTLIGSQVVSTSTTALGLTEFVPSGSTSGFLIVAYAGSTQGVLYSSTGTSWTQQSGAATLDNSAKNRFATLGASVFRVNGKQAMTSSVDGSVWVTTNCLTTVVPSLVMRTKSRLIAAGDNTFKDRVYFSSIIDPNSNPFITWNNNAATGDWIDINPDDGSNVTGFAEASGLILVFKGKGMYRLNVVSKTVDTDNIFNIGAVSQEGIVNCQGTVYFFSGYDIRMTSGDFPQQISRLGVQDWIDAIPQANWASVCAGTDGFNVYFSIGSVTLNSNQDNQKTYNNVVLKFSTRDQSWSVHSYPTAPAFYTQFTTSGNARKMICSDNSGNVQTVNLGTTDNTSPIYFALETQENELGVPRSHNKHISDKIVVHTNNGKDSSFSVKADDGDFQVLEGNLNKRVNVIKKLPTNLDGNFFTFKWSGNSSGTAPVFEGYEIPSFDDGGIEN